MRQDEEAYTPLRDYALLSDCHCAALVSRAGSVDWCCLPRMDAESNFGRLLDWKRGGFWSIAPVSKKYESSRQYEPDTLVLTTRFRTPEGEIKLYDFLAMSDAHDIASHHLHVRMVEGLSGEVELTYILAARFDYGAIIPCVHVYAEDLYAAWGSNQGLIIYSEPPLQINEDGSLATTLKISAGQRLRFSARFIAPERLNDTAFQPPESPAYLDKQLEDTLAWWRRWTRQIFTEHCGDEQTKRSAILLKGLVFEQTGAMVAAATTSLPERIGAERNWDYRYSWVRDSVFAARALHALGFRREADRFAAFIERSAGGSAEQLQALFGVDGKRRLTEIELGWLEGYRHSRPVRIGNLASEQLQLDCYGELLELAWFRHGHGQVPEPRHWRFLVDIVNVAARRWCEPDHGIWEVRSPPQHFVFSKAMCWVALNRGIALAQHYGFEAPVDHWMQTREKIKTSIDQQGYDAQRGVFRQAFENNHLDASLLLLPWFNFVGYNDPRMVRTIDAIRTELENNGLLLRYRSSDGLTSPEGAFLPCTFWLVDCLAHQEGREKEAMAYYQRAVGYANDVGLFSEEYDLKNNEMLGNLPQGITHVSQIVARLALDKVDIPDIGALDVLVNGR